MALGGLILAAVCYLTQRNLLYNCLAYRYVSSTCPSQIHKVLGEPNKVLLAITSGFDHNHCYIYHACILPIRSTDVRMVFPTANGGSEKQKLRLLLMPKYFSD